MSKFDAVKASTTFLGTGVAAASAAMGGAAAVSAAASAAATGAATAATGGLLAAAVPIIGWVAGPVMILLGKIFHGADPRQVPASQIQQAFEAASNNLHYVGKAGMISREEAVAGMRAFLRKGDEFFKESEKALGKAGTAGKAGMHKTIETEITATQRLVATTRTRSLDLVAAPKLYEKPGKAGWYKESLEAGGRLADSYLASLPQNVAEKATGLVTKATSLLTAPLCESFPVPTWIVAAGVLLLGLLVGGADG